MTVATWANTRNPGGAPIVRRFVQVGARRVHYLRAGEGPPVVLIHASPYNGSAWLAAMRQWSRHFTCYALDTPGFGESDPLPVAQMNVMGLTPALAETIRALGLPPCGVVGSHTGAAVALELGVQFPELVTGVVLEGLPLFTAAEITDWFTDEYFVRMKVSPHGEHLTWAWTRVRDADQWFPWIRREPRFRYADVRGSAEKLHSDVLDYYLCAEHFIPAYRSAVLYGEQCVVSLATLERPALITASSADLMFEHMERLPPLKPTQATQKLGPDPREFFAAVETALLGFGPTAPAPADRAAWPAATGIAKQFVDLGDGRVMVRYSGTPAPDAVVLLHDAPGTGRALEPLLLTIGASRFAIAPDLPGCGDTDPGEDGGDMAAIARRLAATLTALGITRATLYGAGIGATVALALKAAHPGLVGKVAIDGLLLPDEHELPALLAHYAPPVAIKDNGSHWYDVWLMLRDALTAWPWFDGTPRGVRVPALPGDAKELHRLTVEVMKQHASYQAVIQAALTADVRQLLHDHAHDLLRCAPRPDRYDRYRPALAQLAGIDREALGAW